MGAKESRIGFLSYEEALRRGEGGGVWASCRGGGRRAARGWVTAGETRVEGVGLPRRKGRTASGGDRRGGPERGRVGSGVGELGPMEGGEAFPERGV